MSKLAKQTVDLGVEAPKGSKIRRDPPPAAEARTILRFRDDNDQRAVILGMVAFAFALFVIFLNFSDYLNDYF